MARKRKESDDEEAADSDADQRGSDESEEELRSSSKKKKSRMASQSNSRRTQHVEDNSNDEAEGGPGIGNRTPATPSNAKPTFTTNVTLKLDGRLNRKVGAPDEPPRYTSSTRSNALATSLSTEDLRSVVSTTTRLVLGRQLNGKPVTGSEIAQIALSKLAGTSDKKDFNKLLLGYIRVEVAKRLKDVFGFNLFAGGEELQLTEKWQVVNSLENDALKFFLGSTELDTINEDPENDRDDDYTPEQRNKVKEEADMDRAVLMIVLAVIMIHKDAALESDLHADLEKFGFSRETTTKLKRDNLHFVSIPDSLSKLMKRGFLEKEKNKSGKYMYRMGKTALNEIGKRNVLLFMAQSCNFKLDELDEAVFLQIREEIA